MADVDKSLPNVEQEIKVPSPEDIEVAQEEKQQEVNERGEPVEITENEDGSVDVNYDPSIASVEGEINHYDNLAEHLPDDILGRLGTSLYQNYTDDKTMPERFHPKRSLTFSAAFPLTIDNDPIRPALWSS